MYKNRCLLEWVIVLGVLCAGLSRAVAEEDLTYQCLTNLGPYASSRVLLMNNDENAVCPIHGQGYHDTDSNTVVVGQTYWWHDDTPVTEKLGSGNAVSIYINLQDGIRHILYQRQDDISAPVKLWELDNCRAGSSARKSTSGTSNFNYLPWSSTCQPIDAETYTVPPKIPDTWAQSAADSNGVKQVAVITMRAAVDSAGNALAKIYSPLYREGIGDIYFDAVNFSKNYVNSHIAVEVAKSRISSDDGTSFEEETDWSKFRWERVPCEVFKIYKDGKIELDDRNVSAREISLYSTASYDNQYFRIRVPVDYHGAVRFRIVRTNVGYPSGVTRYEDYNDIISIDNIVVSYPIPQVILSPTGIDAKGEGKAKIGRVGAFTEPLLNTGISTAKPRMKCSAETNGLPSLPFITWNASVTNSDFVWRWSYLNQEATQWTTNKMSLAENGKELMGDTSIVVPDTVGDIEYYYVADVTGTHYKYFDFANDTPIDPYTNLEASVSLRYPDTDADPNATNYWSRIREGASLWQEMHLVSEVFTNLEENASVTNDWTMELTSDHTWRGFVWTPTNYTDKVAHIRFVGKNLWETNAVSPVRESNVWYFPPSVSQDTALDFPMGSVAVTNLGEQAERDITLDCTAGYLIFEFNDESGSFIVNRAEYQDFNKWTPEAGQAEDRYIGNYVNTSYVGSAKQAYTFELSKLTMSRSSSSYWWENFDSGADTSDYPFDVPFTQDQLTPNGWTANNGMFINGLFSAATNREIYGMALQLQGRGLGELSLIDSPDVPKGIGTVSFSTRLAQYLEFENFYYYVDGTAEKNYAISAKAAMTTQKQPYSDVSTGSPSLSLVTYYRPGQGCYEFRVTRVYATDRDHLWDSSGVMEMGIYKWEEKWDSESGKIKSFVKKLKSLRLGGSSTTYNPQLSIGRYYTNGSNRIQFQNYFVPPTSATNTNNVPDNRNWTSVYFAAYTATDGKSTYLEGGVGGTYSATTDASTELRNTTGIMMSLNVTDTKTDDNVPFKKGSYGVCSRECPATFGNIQRHRLNNTGPYRGKNKTVFSDGNKDEEAQHFDDDEWGSGAPGRMMTWKQRKLLDGKEYIGLYDYGVCAAPMTQQLYLKYSDQGNSSSWRDSGLKLNLTSYVETNVVFAPHTTVSANVKIAVGGNQGDPRTDVVVDNVELSQWAGDSSASSDLGSTAKWAYTDAWITGTTNEVYQSAGSVDNADEIASISKCKYYCYKVPGTDNDYIYVFTNTANGTVTFTPKVDITVKELFVLGGGGGGGPGGGGGGGGESLWITNAVDYSAGESGIRLYVGTGGSGGQERYSNNALTPSIGGNGGNSYVYMKNPFNEASVEQYRGYGGYYGGAFRNSYDAGGGSSNGGGAGGGSARKNTTRAYGREIYGAGYGGKADNGAPGGGGGGGLRGIGEEGSNYAAGGATNPKSVIHAGLDGENGTGDATGGKGGDGFPLEVMGDSYIRTAIGDLLGDQDAWLGGGGGGGSGRNTTAASVSNWGVGAYTPGSGGKGGGGQGGLYTAGSYNSDYQLGMGHAAQPFTGGGGGGSFNDPVSSGSNAAKNWILGGGKGADGLVVMHVQVKDRYVMLQPMRGDEGDPMSVRTLFLNGISLLSFSWKWADSNAVLRVQVATNDVDGTTIRNRTLSLSAGWTDVVNVQTNFVSGGMVTNFNGVIRFSEISEADRKKGSTNIIIGLRAPISGIVRVLVDPEVVAEARKGSTNDLYSMYGAVLVTGMKVYDHPELDDRSWWGWNIMPTYRLEWSSLYDPMTLGPGRSCGLNFTGVLSPAPEGDPDYYDAAFAEDPSEVHYEYHDPFIQTPRFTNGIGTVSFLARPLLYEGDDVNRSAWVTVSACADLAAGEDDDTKWDVLTNIEIKATDKFFRPYSWRIPTSKSKYQALRLSTFAAAQGRDNSQTPASGQKFGDMTSNPTPIKRVLIDEMTVTQPMAPKIAFVNAYPFRMKMSDDTGNAIAAEKIAGPDAQPLLNEMFGFQAQVVPAGMEDELDRDSIRVYMAWYSGESPWGYENWKDLSEAVNRVELARAADWSEGNLVYRSASTNMSAFVPPQLAGDAGYQIVQYHLWAEYRNKNNIDQDPHELSSTDWITPGWYRGIDDPNKGGTFSAYTVLDTISPKRAWFNEINMFDEDEYDTTHQYLEIAVPQGFDMMGWSLDFIKHDGSYRLRSLADFGTDVVRFKSSNATNSYAFIAIQSPKTKAAGSYPGVDDGTWKATAFDGGVEDVSSPYALRFRRPTGIIEHEVVYMCTNMMPGHYGASYEGTNFLKLLNKYLPESDWIYAGADAYSGSLGVYTNHGEATSCWTNTMRQTPGKVNLMADGTPQFIDPDYFDPPGGTNLWIYANIDGGSLNSLQMILGNVTNTSAVIIVPQDPDTGVFSTSIVYVVRKWFELDSVVTNEYGKAGGSVAEASGKKGVWTLDLSNIKIAENSSRKFEVTASTRNSSNIPDADHGGISPTDPYYPAVIDWLQNFDEKNIHLAPFWTLNDVQTKRKDGSDCILNLKEMYWFDIPPVTDSDTDEWVLKGGMGAGATPYVFTNIVANGLATNIKVTVTMMITNRVTGEAHAPNTLRGLEPGSTSSNYNASVSGGSWTSVTFKVTGALQNGRVDNIYRPLRWFTFGPNSFTNGFTREIEVKDPFSKGSPGYSYEWYKHPGCSVFYRWRVDADETNRPPDTVYLLNDESASLSNED